MCYNFPPELICEGLSVFSRIGESKLRAIPMYWTGDHPAQTKVAKFKLSGYNACHCHKNVTKKLDGSKVLYPDNQRQAHDPPPYRKIKIIYEEALSFQTGASSSRSKRATFITSFFKLRRLYEICGFNLCLDLVYDSMHILSLNLFKSFVEQLVSEGEAVAIDEALDEISTHHLVLDGQLVMLIDFHIEKLKNFNILFFDVCLIIWKILNNKLISSSAHK